MSFPSLQKENLSMTRQFGVLSVVVLCLASLSAQQKGQWTPGQYGLNACVIPAPDSPT